jgi:predicted O-methyltransferase YrrM
MSRRTLQMTDAILDYAVRHGVREHPELAGLRAETAALAEAEMQVAPEQGALLQMLVRLTGARRVLEVGTFTGYSSLAMALALPADGRLIACDVSAEWTAVARRHWQAAGVADRIELRLAPALETMAALLATGEAGRFDLAFLDADKANYPRYAALALELMRPGGLLVVDNVLWSGRVADPAVRDADTEGIRELNARLHADPRVDLCLVPIADGVTLARKR